MQRYKSTEPAFLTNRVFLLVVLMASLLLNPLWTSAGEICDASRRICFHGIGRLEGGTSSFAQGIDYVNGTVVVVGSANSSTTQTIGAGNCGEAVKYSNGELRPVLNTPTLQLASGANDVALVGGQTMIVGQAFTCPGLPRGIRAEQNGNELVAPTFLPVPVGVTDTRNATGISDDGQFIVGTTAQSGFLNGGFKWARSTNTSVSIPPLNPNLANLRVSPSRVSPNGVFTGGSTSRTDTFVQGFVTPVPNQVCVGRACSPGGFEQPTGFDESFIDDLTNGGLAVGQARNATGTVSAAFLWFPGRSDPPLAPRTVFLGDLPGGSSSSFASTISGDGTVIAGNSSSTAFPNGEAILWHSSFGMRSLREIALEDYGITELEGWTLQSVTDMSTNGLAICGRGINSAAPGEGNEGWYMTLPDCNGNGRWDGLENPIPSARAPRSVLEFDGVDDFAERAVPSNDLRIAGPLTIEAWVFLQRLGVNQSIVTMGEAGEDLASNILYSIEVDAGGDIVVTHERSTLADVFVVADTNLRTNRWYHLAVTRTFVTASLLEYAVYVDDLDPIVEGAAGAPAGGTSGRLRIGRAPGTVVDRPFDGLISDLRIWNVVRSTEAIRENLLTSQPADTTGLLASWRMDEPSGTTLDDSIGGNDLTLSSNGIRQNVDADCNFNRILDSCETDCNDNGIPDDCDIRDGTSCDRDGTGRPDECEALEVLADLANQESVTTEFFRTERETPGGAASFGTMIRNYGRPWKPGTGQTPGGGFCEGGSRAGMSCGGELTCPNGVCVPPAGTGTGRDPAERLRSLIGDSGCLAVDVVQRILNELFAFEMLLGNEAFVDAVDPTVGEGVLGEGISLEQVSGLFSFRGLQGIGSLLAEELALLRGREIVLPPSTSDPLNDDPTTNLNGNYPQFGQAPRAAIYNRLRPNAAGTFGTVAYKSNYGKTSDEEASAAFPQGHGDAYGYYLRATKLYLDVFGAQSPADALRFIESQFAPSGSTDCQGVDCEEVLDDDGVAHQVTFHSVRNMAAAMAAKARTVNRIVDLTFRQDYREDTDTLLSDTDPARAWGVADWARRGGVGAYLDWAALNHLLPVPEPGSGNSIETVDRRRVEETRLLASAVNEMQERVDAAGAGLNPLGLVSNVVPFRIIQPGQLLNFLQGGASAGKSHYGIVRDAAIEAIKNARGILQRANLALNRLGSNEQSFEEFENRVRDSDIGLNNRLIEIFGSPSADDRADNDAEDNDGDGEQLTDGLNDPDDDAIEAGCGGKCAGSADLQSFLVDAQAMEELEFSPRASVGQVQLAMFELRTAGLRVQAAQLAIANLEALIQDKAENVALVREEAIETLEIRADACADQMRIIDRKEQLAEAREDRGMFSRIVGTLGAATVCASGGKFACSSAASGGLGLGQELLSNFLLAGGPGSEIDEQFDIEREELRINCWQTAQLTRISNDQQIRALEIELEDLIRRTPQAILELVVAQTQAQQALAVVQKNFQEGKRLLDERDRIRRVQSDKLQDFRFRDLAFRTFRNQALEQYGAFFDLASRYVMLAARAFAYEYNERDEVDDQMRALYRERLLGTESAADMGLQSVIARLDQKRQESDFLARLQKLSLFDHGGDEFSLRKNFLGLAIDPSRDTAPQQREKNKAFRAFLESNVVQELRDVPAFRQLASLDSDRDAGPALVLSFSTEVAGRTLFGQRRGTTFGAPANFDTCSNPKLFEFAILLEGVDNPGAIGVDSQLIFAHLIPVGSSMLRSPESGDCALRSVRTWQVVDQRIPGVSAVYRDTGDPTLDAIIDPDFDRPRLVTSPELDIINRFPVTQAQLRNTDSPVFQDDLAGWSVWNTQWMLVIPGRQFADPNDDAAVVRRKLLILIFDADQSGNPRSPDANLGIDDIKLRIKAYGKPS